MHYSFEALRRTLTLLPTWNHLTVQALNGEPSSSRSRLGLCKAHVPDYLAHGARNGPRRASQDCLEAHTRYQPVQSPHAQTKTIVLILIASQLLNWFWLADSSKLHKPVAMLRRRKTRRTAYALIGVLPSLCTDHHCDRCRTPLARQSPS